MTQLATDSSFSTKITTAATILLAKPDVYLSDWTREIVTFVVNLIIHPLLSVFGIITNIISITVFIKLGFSDSVNTALLGLSLSDLSLLLVVLWESVCYFPPFRQADFSFDPYDSAYVTGGIPLTYFGRTTSWITAFITLERYLCVAFPLKEYIIFYAADTNQLSCRLVWAIMLLYIWQSQLQVKTWSTPRRSTTVVVCIYVLMAATVAPLFYTSRVDMKFFSDKNTTRLGLVFTSDRHYLTKYVSPFNNIIVQLGSFLFVVVFTVLLFFKLRNNNKWREQTTDKAVLLSRRDQKVALMIILVSSNFIICYAGITAEYIWPMFAPEFTSGVAYRNIFFVLTAFAIMTQQITASTNLFIYLKMSSKYRRVVHSMCECVITK